MKSPSVTILLVEDNRLVMDLVKEVLEEEGWLVAAYEDASSALQKLESLESGDKYDLIITDNDLLGFCGLELVRRARKLQRYKHTPIIMFSANPSYQAEALIAGADVFLRKPEDVGALPEMVARLLN